MKEYLPISLVAVTESPSAVQWNLDAQVYIMLLKATVKFQELPHPD